MVNKDEYIFCPMPRSTPDKPLLQDSRETTDSKRVTDLLSTAGMGNDLAARASLTDPFFLHDNQTPLIIMHFITKNHTVPPH